MNARRNKDIVIVPAWSKYWYEVGVERRTTMWSTTVDLACTVLRRNNLTWNSVFKKPIHLIEVLTTIDGAPRIVKVQDPNKVAWGMSKGGRS